MALQSRVDSQVGWRAISLLFPYFLTYNHGQFGVGCCSKLDNLHAPENSARSLRRNWPWTIKLHPLGGFEICSPVHLSVSGIPNAPEQFCRPRPVFGARAHFISRFRLEKSKLSIPSWVNWRSSCRTRAVSYISSSALRVSIILHELMASVGKTVTTSNTMQRPSRRFRDIPQNLAGPIGCWLRC